jgi:hypothetical protein
VRAWLTLALAVAFLIAVIAIFRCSMAYAGG